MSMTCRTCCHPDRKAIDKRLAAGEPQARIAAEYGLRETSVRRHTELHLKPALSAKAAELDRHYGSIVTHLRDLLDKALEILRSPEDQRVALMAVREARGVLETIGQVSGELLPTQVQQVYIGLGVADETELRKIITQHKALSSFGIDDAERDAVEALKLVFAEKPERKEAILAELSSGAELVEGSCSDG